MCGSEQLRGVDISGGEVSSLSIHSARAQDDVARASFQFKSLFSVAFCNSLTKKSDTAAHCAGTCCARGEKEVESAGKMRKQGLII